MLIAAERLRDACVFLERAQPRSEQEWTERLFLLGRIEMRLGMPENAVKRFETILERHPDLTRVQLELAAAYYASGIDDKAKLHFKFSLAQKLPFSVEATVVEFLRQIDARRPWSASFAFSLLPESNPSRSSKLKVVSVGGLPLELDQVSRPSSGVGGLFSGGVSHSPPISAVCLQYRAQRKSTSTLNRTMSPLLLILNCRSLLNVEACRRGFGLAGSGLEASASVGVLAFGLKSAGE